MSMTELSIVIDPDMKEGSLYMASSEPSDIKCLNGLYLHKVTIDLMKSYLHEQNITHQMQGE
jgi:hypothetical protein